MNDDKTPESENQDDSFNEDFDFGENEHEPLVVRSSEKKAPNKKVLMSIVAIAVIGVIVLGYKFYGSSTKSSTTKSSVAMTASKQTVPTTLQTQPPLKPNAPPTNAAGKPGMPAQSANPAQEQNFGDLAQAFSSTDKTPTPPPAPPATTTKEVGTIQDLQKELFAPEHAPVAGSGSTNATHPNASVSSTPNTAAATVKPEVGKAKIETPAEVPASNSSEIAQLGDNLAKLNQQIEFISNKIKYLDAYTHEVSNNLTKLNESINSMENRVSTLTNTTTSLSKDVGSVRNEVGHVKEILKEDGLELSPAAVAPHRKRASAHDGKIIIEEPEYVVHAVIPGRAWLKSPKGRILTVTEGDTVGNYGKILVIDATNGVVLTSSGVTFR